MENVSDKRVYNYKDYLSLRFEKPIEIINGEIFFMAPAPSRIHQKIITELSRKIGNYIEDNKGECEVYVAPFDVRLKTLEDTNEDNIKNIVQPDISIICDRSKLDDRGCLGSPDFIVEVVSPSNSSMDYVKKLYLYEKFQVREYWIINPNTETVMTYLLNENRGYDEPKVYKFKDQISMEIFPSFKIKMSEIM